MIKDKPSTTFDDVAGADEAKMELEEIIEFLKTDNVRIYSTEMPTLTDYDETRIKVCYDATTLKIITVANG